MSFTSELTIPPNAAPITTPTARSIAFPRTANFWNSCTIVMACPRRLIDTTSVDLAAALANHPALRIRRGFDNRPAKGLPWRFSWCLQGTEPRKEAQNAQTED